MFENSKNKNIQNYLEDLKYLNNSNNTKNKIIIINQIIEKIKTHKNDYYINEDFDNFEKYIFIENLENLKKSIKNNELVENIDYFEYFEYLKFENILYFICKYKDNLLLDELLELIEELENLE